MMMETKDPEIRIFDGKKFPVWKFYMELCFSSRKVMPHVTGSIPKPADDAPEAEKLAWIDADNIAKNLIGASVSMSVLENLINCTTAASMWTTLCSLYQQKSKENIYMVQNNFYEYKMSVGDTINTHVNKVVSMGNLLKDLGKPVDEDMLVTKIICSLPPIYNSIVTAWSNVPIEQQTVGNLKARLLQLEHLLAMQGGDLAGDSAFFTRSNKVYSQNRKPNQEQNKEYIKHLKGRTRCYNCGEYEHWTAECPYPKKDRDRIAHQRKATVDHQHRFQKGKRGAACAATSDQPTSDSEPDQDPEPEAKAFMVVSKRSQAMSVNLDERAWYADSGATEHMTERREWFSTFKAIPPGTWAVAVADDRDLWVRGIGDINITRLVDGVNKKGVMRKVLYIPGLRRNLFSIGLATKAGIAFQALRDRCVLHDDFGEGPKVMEGERIGTLYKLSIVPVPPPLAQDISTYTELSQSVLDTAFTDQSSSTAFAVNTSRDAELVLWHNRMAHVNVHTLKTMSLHESVKDLPILSSSKLLQVCSGCALGKQHKSTYPSDPQKERSRVPGELLHADLSGKMSTPSLGGSNYYILIKDDCTAFRFIAFLKTKNEAIKFFLKVLRIVQRTTGHSVQTLRTDRGSEFCNTDFDSLLEHEGILRETSMAYTPQQNGYIERDNRTICEAARSMIHLHNLPIKLWAEAVHTAVYVLNRTINHQVGHMTPYELWFHTKPSVSHFKTFGTLAYIFIDKSKRTKFQPKGSRVIFVGYSDTSKGWRFWNPLTGLISESSDVVFDEVTGYSPLLFSKAPPPRIDIPSSIFLDPTLFPVNPIPPPQLQLPPPVNPPPVNPVGVSSPTASLHSLPPDSPTFSDPSSPSPSLPVPNDNSSSESVHSDPYDINIPAPIHVNEHITVPEHPIKQRYRSLTDIYSDTLPTTPSPPISPVPSPAHSPVTSQASSFANMIHSAETYREPATYKQATMSPQAAYWKAAMEREYDSLMENRTWILVPPPPGRTIIQCKWVYKIKYNSAGEIDKYKARLVAKGYSQVHGIDYDETFSPVIKHDSIRVLFAIAAVQRMHMRQFDIGTAYLNSDLATRIYMQQPEGFVDPHNPSYVCSLLKSLYGLKQSGRLWNHTFDIFLKLYHLLTSDADTCVYYRLTAANTVDLIVGIFVDDGIVCATSEADLDAVIQHLQTNFKVTHGPMDYYVGFQIHRNTDTHAILINQARYITDILHRFQLDTANTITTPADTHVPLQNTLGSDDQPLPPTVPYREAVGCLMYAMVMTRPDIAFAVSRVAKYTSNPHYSHWTAVKRIFRYLSGTITMGLSYSGTSTDLSLQGYCDADYAGDHDDRKSRTGYLFILANAAVAWCSKRQGCTADSTTEAEFVAMSESVKEAIWLRRLLQSLGFPTTVPTPIFSDNQGAIQLVKNPKFHKRTKHIETKYYLIREKYDNKQIDVFYIHTKQQLADILTKPLPREAFQHLRTLHGLLAPSLQTSGRT